MPRGDDWPLANIHILNNLLVRNYITADTITRGCDLTIYMGCPEYGPYRRTATSNDSDDNVFADTGWTPTMRHSWNPDNTLAQWQERFKEDLHSAPHADRVRAERNGFVLTASDRLKNAAPLNDETLMRFVQPPPHVGCCRSAWPCRTERYSCPRRDPAAKATTKQPKP